MSNQQQEIIKRCQKSVLFFLRNFVKIKHPSAGIIPLNPFQYQVHALKSFRDNQFTIFKKCRQCFDGSAMVWGPSGSKRIDEIKFGDLVYTYNQSTGLLEIVPVGQVFDNGERDCVEVRTESGHRAIATEDHLYFTPENETKAGDLKVGEHILEVTDCHRHGKTVTDVDATILGYILGGAIIEDDTIRFSSSRKVAASEYKKNLVKRFGIHPSIDSVDGEWVVETKHKSVLGCMRGMSKNIYGMPEDVFSWDRKSLAILLNRMFCCSAEMEDGLVLTSDSKEFLCQIRQLLSRFNIHANIKSNKLQIIEENSYTNFINDIGMFGRETPSSISIKSLSNDGFGKVKKVTKVGKRRVYDISVPPHHNYIVDGAVVHNSGLSQISGVFALWFGMFFPNKTILIVSKNDNDAMTYLHTKIVFSFNNLPKWMQELWKPIKKNDHEIVFPNGSSIKSLNSAPDCLRSNASSLNIIDESAFIPEMSGMWAAGYPTLQHGGSVIVISTTNGVGNWYWSTWTDAEAGMNRFNSIDIAWWDMDWNIEYVDDLSGRPVRIAPCDDIRECQDPTEISKFGKYWSPWLEEQYRGLQERGEPWKFDQEVLAQFVGSGNTILEQSALDKVLTTLDDEFKTVDRPAQHTHPVTQQIRTVDFSGSYDGYKSEEGLWIWEKPVIGQEAKVINNQIVEHAQQPHLYVAGVDLATGKGQDFNALEIFDATTLEQVAELMIHCKPKEFIYMIDYLGRYYNNALMVIERNNGGDQLIDDIREELLYPNLWRRRKIKDKVSKNGKSVTYDHYGHHTSRSSKPHLNHLLVTHFRSDNDGFTVYSRRLHKQMQIYVRKKTRSGQDTEKTEAEDGPGNHDDLVIASALALVALNDVAIGTDILIPFQPQLSLSDTAPPINVPNVIQPPNLDGGGGIIVPGQHIMEAFKGDTRILPPMRAAQETSQEETIGSEMMRFSAEIGGMNLARNMPVVVKKKHSL